MIDLTSEITDEVSFGHHLHLCPQMKKNDKVPCLGAQVFHYTTISVCQSDALPTRLSWPLKVTTLTLLDLSANSIP